MSAEIDRASRIPWDVYVHVLTPEGDEKHVKISLREVEIQAFYEYLRGNCNDACRVAELKTPGRIVGACALQPYAIGSSSGPRLFYVEVWQYRTMFLPSLAIALAELQRAAEYNTLDHLVQA